MLQELAVVAEVLGLHRAVQVGVVVDVGVVHLRAIVQVDGHPVGVARPGVRAADRPLHVRARVVSGILVSGGDERLLHRPHCRLDGTRHADIPPSQELHRDQVRVLQPVRPAENHHCA